MRKPTATAVTPAQLRDWALPRHDEGDDKVGDVLAKRVGPLGFLAHRSSRPKNRAR